MHPTYRPSGRGEAGPGDDEGHGDGPEGGNEWSEEVEGVVCWVGWNYCFPTHVGRLIHGYLKGVLGICWSALAVRPLKVSAVSEQNGKVS